MRRRTPPRHLTEAFHKAGLSWYLHGEAPDNVLRLYDGGPACWLAQFDEFERPCSGELEVFHFIGRQRIRNVLSPLLLEAPIANSFEVLDAVTVADLLELAEWDPRNAGPACEGHHRRFDSHLTPELKVPLEALPFPAVLFVTEWALDFEAERKFSRLPDPRSTVERVTAAPPSEAGAAAGLQQQQPPLVGAGAGTCQDAVRVLRRPGGEDGNPPVSADSGESGHIPSASSAGVPGLGGLAGPHSALSCTGTAKPDPSEADR